MCCAACTGLESVLSHLNVDLSFSASELSRQGWICMLASERVLAGTSVDGLETVQKLLQGAVKTWVGQSRGECS